MTIMLFIADNTIVLDSLPGAKTGVGVVAATAGIVTHTSCAITLPPGPLPCRDYNTNDITGEVDKQHRLQLPLNYKIWILFPVVSQSAENTLLIL